MEEVSGIRCQIEKDCRKRIRLKLQLPVEVRSELEHFFPGCTFRVHQFSQFVANAKDVYELQTEKGVLLKAIAGTPELEVTFLKEAEQVPKREIEEFMRHLSQYCKQTKASYI